MNERSRDRSVLFILFELLCKTTTENTYSSMFRKTVALATQHCIVLCVSVCDWGAGTELAAAAGDRWCGCSDAWVTHCRVENMLMPPSLNGLPNGFRIFAPKYWGDDYLKVYHPTFANGAYIYIWYVMITYVTLCCLSFLNNHQHHFLNLMKQASTVVHIPDGGFSIGSCDIHGDTR